MHNSAPACALMARLFSGPVVTAIHIYIYTHTYNIIYICIIICIYGTDSPEQTSEPHSHTAGPVKPQSPKRLNPEPPQAMSAKLLDCLVLSREWGNGLWGRLLENI